MSKRFYSIALTSVLLIALFIGSMFTVYAANEAEIISQPESVTVIEGETAVITVDAAGDGLTYEWYYRNAGSKDFRLTSTFTGNEYSVVMNPQRNGRQVYCIITDSYGNSVITETVTIRMAQKVKIEKQPESVSVPVGTSAKVSLEATGEELTYKWYYKDSGSDSFKLTSSFKGNSYTVTMTDARNGRQLYCVVADKYGNTVTSDAVTISKKHILDEGTIEKAPSCTENGVMVYTCSECSEKIRAEITAEGHKTGTWTVIKEATETENGIEIRNCKYCDYNEERTLSKDVKVNYITVNTGNSSYKIGVSENESYEIEAPEKPGYTFLGWSDDKGNTVANTGTSENDMNLSANWEIERTETLADLLDKVNSGVDKILISADITVTEPIFISYDTVIYSDGDYKILRDKAYTGDIFVVGQNNKGISSVLMHRKAVLTLGGGKGTLTVDGNKDNITEAVKGSAVFVSDSSYVNILDGARITNHRKLGNERVLNCKTFASEEAIVRAGGAAVLIVNGEVNMYGGLIDNNEVISEIVYITDDKGNSYVDESAACGGAIYNRGNFNMYGGTVSENLALRGGAIYNDEIINLENGTVTKNNATTYGGGISASGSSDVELFIGSEKEEYKMTISDNSSKKAGGGIYSNTNSPIVIFGNTSFEHNHSDSIGGAVYTGGALTVRHSEFIGNTSASMGGAIYHSFSNPDFDRRHFTLSDSSFSKNSAIYGGAISLGASESIEGMGTYANIRNCSFNSNSAVTEDGSYGDGGAIYCSHYSKAVINGCNFTNNSASVNAGAVRVHSNSDVTSSNSVYENNSSPFGGAIAVASGKLSLSNDTINGNSGTYGGAVFANPSDIIITSTAFSGNKSTSGGGAVYLNGAGLTLNGSSEFTENETSGRGGAIYATYNGEICSVIDATDGVFTSNTAASGGAVSIRTGCSASFTGSVFNMNSSTDPNPSNSKEAGGGAVEVKYGTLDLTDVKMDKNTSGNYGGAVMVHASDISMKNSTVSGSSASTGSAVYLYNCTAPVITDCTLTENTAKWNGAVYSNAGTLILTGITAQNNKAANGGAFYISGGDATLTDITANNNTAEIGGVVYVGGGNVTVTKSELTENSATFGGAVGIEAGTATVTECTASKNSGTNGGVLYSSKGTLTVADTEFTENKGSYGGVLFANPSTATVTSVKFDRNEAVNAGGAICVNGGTVTATGENTFTGNTAAVRGGAVDVTFAGETNGLFEITDGSFTGNEALTGGAVSVRTNCKATFLNTGFTENKSTAENTANEKTVGGGAVYGHEGSEITLNKVNMSSNTSLGYGGTVMINGGSVEIGNDSVISGSSASTGAAVYIYNGKTSSIADSVISDNTAKWNGAVYSNAGTLTIENVTASGNKADKGAAFYVSGGTVNVNKAITSGNSAKYGGAIYLGSGALNITGGSYTENSSIETGGVILAEGGTLTVNGMTAEKNTSYKGGVIYASSGTHTVTSLLATENSGTFGGAIYVIGENTVLSTKASTFTKHTATNGGAAYVAGGTYNSIQDDMSLNEASSCGGAIYATPSTVNINEVSFTENSAPYGGAISLNGTALNVTGATAFIKNTASTRGGAVDATIIDGKHSTINMTDGSFTENEAPVGGAVYLRTNSKATFTETAFTSNKSTDANASNDKTVGGGAVYAHEGTELTLSKSLMTNNTSANYGGTVMVNGGSVTVEDNSVISNSSASTGAAVYIYNGKTSSITDSVISDNTAKWNGAVYSNAGTLTIENVTASGNKADKGAAFYVSGGTVNVNEATTSGNSAKYGGAIYLGSGALNITGGTYTENSSIETGGVILAEGGTLTVNGMTAEKNTSYKGGVIYASSGTHTVTSLLATENSGTFGGAVYVINDSTTVNLINCDLSGNTATNGGAVYVASGKLNTDNGTMSGNTASSCGGAIFAVPSAVTVKDTTFSENSAPYGGAVSLNGTVFTVSGETKFNKNTASIRGGGIDATLNESVFSTINMTEGSFTENEAPVGGAVYLRTNSKAAFTGTVFTSNKSTDTNSGNSKNIGGGAVYAHTNAEVTLSGVTLDKNYSAKYGGAVMLFDAKLTMNNNSVISASKADTHGAALYIYSSEATVTDTSITDNEATWQGAVYIADTSVASFTDVTATGNKANQGGVFCLCDQPTVTLTRVTAKNNTAKAEGGVIYHYAWNGNLNITDCEFSDNTSATKGGAVWAGAKSPVTVSGTVFKNNTSATGGAVYLDSTMFSAASPAKMTVSGNSLFENNISLSGDGGAVYLADSTSDGASATTFIAENTAFNANKSYGKGGAVATDTSSKNLILTLSSCNFTENTAGYNFSGTSYPGGGAIEIQNGNGWSNGDPDKLKIVISDCSFTSNSAPGTGGAIDIRSASYVKINNITATNNSSSKKWNGAAIYLTSEASRLYLTGTVTASGNTAGKYDTFLYSANAKGWVYTDNSSTAPWVGMTYSASGIKFDQTNLPS